MQAASGMRRPRRPTGRNRPEGQLRPTGITFAQRGKPAGYLQAWPAVSMAAVTPDRENL